MNVDKICRCCLTNDGPLLTIYEGGITNKDCLASMINKITGIKLDPNDKLPDKACLLCIREVKDFFAFKIKCENSHRTLQQLFLSKVEVQLCSPIKNSKAKDASENEDEIIVGKYQMTPIEAIHTTQMKVDDEYSQSLNFESNIESTIPTSYGYKCMASSAEETISIPSSPISFQNSSLPIETITHLENSKLKPSSTIDIPENTYAKEFNDSETDSCDSIEFISEKPRINEPIVVLEEFGEMYSTSHNAEVNGTAIEYTFKNVSSPQWVPEEEIYLSLVNEDLNFDNVQRQSTENLSHYPNHLDISAGSRYQCAICEQGFKQKHAIINHLETHEKPYSCIFCGNLFNDYSNLQEHLMEHTNNTLDSHISSNMFLIGSEAPNRAKVKRLKAKNHACDLCPKRFRVASSLINHRRIHTGEKPYKCKYCDRTFIQASTRSNHEKTHTGHRPFKCQYCDKTFVQSGSRTMHERVHTGEKPYKCQYCHRAFIQISVKSRHEETHKKSDIKCPQCDIKFANTSDVLEHFKTQHT